MGKLFQKTDIIGVIERTIVPEELLQGCEEQSYTVPRLSRSTTIDCDDTGAGVASKLLHLRGQGPSQLSHVLID